MYTIIAATNRGGSNTLKVAKQYQLLLKEKGIEAGILSLEDVNVLTRDADFIKMETEILIPTNHYIFISPEYNGSFPGVLKALIDTTKAHQVWWHKKALITGIATGRAGNTRGNDHLASILNHLKITVHPNLLPLSAVDKLMTEEGIFTDSNTLKVIHQQLDNYIVWCESEKHLAL